MNRQRPLMRLLDRRRFLQLGLATFGAGALGATELRRLVSAAEILRLAEPGSAESRARAAGRARTDARARRRLVVIEMAGGNDGMSMVPPYGDPRYRDVRKRTALAESAILPLGNGVGLHPELRRLHARRDRLAVVQGVGVPRPDLSHFETLRRWWTGDLDSRANTLTGFLGRLCDVLGTPDAPAVGVSLGYGPTPALISERVVTVSMDPYSDGSFPVPDGGSVDLADAWRAGWDVMAECGPKEPVPFCSARRGAAYARRFSDLATRLPGGTHGYPDTDLGIQLALAARIVSQDNGVRVVHVPFYGDFDTHENHVARHTALMAQLDAALDAFLVDLAGRGAAGDVLVATASEFGRRVPDNESNGLDHGAASVALLVGPVTGGLYGAYPSLGALDADDDLVATVLMTEYYATIAEGWFGVPAPDLLAGSPRPLAGIVP